MALNEEVLRRSQGAIEAVRGTRQARTTRIYETIRLMDAYEPLDFAEQAGTRSGRHSFVQGPVNVSGTLDGRMTFDDSPFWLKHLINKDDTTLFIPEMESETLASSTIEHGVPDNVYISDMVMLSSATIRADIDDEAAWAISGPLFAKNMDHLGGGFTAAIPLRDRSFIRGAGTKLYIDDAAGDIGETQVLEKFISFNLTWDNALTPKRYMENITGISSRMGVGELRVTGQIRLEFDSDAEKAKYRDAAPRAIRIERTGVSTERIRVDIPRAYWLTPSDDPRDTNMTLTFGFEAYIDAALGYPASIEVIQAA